MALHCFRIDPNLISSIHQLSFWNKPIIWQHDLGVKNCGMLVEYGNHLLELCFVLEYAITANLIDLLLTFEQGL